VITLFVSENIKYITTITTSSLIQIDGLQYIRLNYESIFFNIKRRFTDTNNLYSLKIYTNNY
jgi:hypothetical protein